MLSDQDRGKIADYCVKAVVKGIPPEAVKEGVERLKTQLAGKVRTISCLYAEKNPDEEGWRKSGMENLTLKLAEIAKGKGLRLKRMTPLNNLKNFNDSVLQSIPPFLSKHLAPAETVLAAYRQAIKEEAEACERSLNHKLRGLALDAVNKNLKDDAAIRRYAEKNLEDILDKTRKETIERIAAVMQSEGQNLAEALRSASSPIYLSKENIPKVEDIHRIITLPSDSGKWGALAGGAGAGAATLLFITNPLLGLGLTLAGVLGGKKVAEHLGGERTERQVVGDTRDEVIPELEKILIAAARKVFKPFTESLADKYLTELKTWIDGLRRCFEETEKELRAQNKNLDRAISEISAAGQ